jgi:glutathione S-transferase
MGEVPVMVDGGLTLSQSGAIQDYISSKGGKLGGRSANERREIMRWVLWDNHKLSSQSGHDPLPDELPARRQAPPR